MTLPVIDPVVPKLGKYVPVGREWRYEVKLDGFRATLYVDEGRAQRSLEAISPSRLSFTVIPAVQRERFYRELRVLRRE